MVLTNPCPATAAIKPGVRIGLPRMSKEVSAICVNSENSQFVVFKVQSINTCCRRAPRTLQTRPSRSAEVTLPRHFSLRMATLHPRIHFRRHLPHRRLLRYRCRRRLRIPPPPSCHRVTPGRNCLSGIFWIKAASLSTLHPLPLHLRNPIWTQIHQLPIC